MELRGASRTRIRPASGGHWFPPGPYGVSTPFGLLPGRTTQPDRSGRGPPVRFRFPSEAHRSTPAPSRGPEGPARRTMHPSLSFLTPQHMPERRTRMGAEHPAPRVPRPRFDHLLRGVHHRPSGNLAAPERSRASPYQAFSSRRSVPLPGAPALLTLRASHRLAPRWSEADGAAFRASIPTSNSFAASLAGCRAVACLGFTPPELSLLPSSRARCRPRTVPHHALGGIDVPTCLRLGVFRCGRLGIVPLGTAGSPGISYLMTVAAPLRPLRGAGV